jgi:hypothetical protein
MSDTLPYLPEEIVDHIADMCLVPIYQAISNTNDSHIIEHGPIKAFYGVKWLTIFANYLKAHLNIKRILRNPVNNLVRFVMNIPVDIGLSINQYVEHLIRFNVEYRTESLEIAFDLFGSVMKLEFVYMTLHIYGNHLDMALYMQKIGQRYNPFSCSWHLPHVKMEHMRVILVKNTCTCCDHTCSCDKCIEYNTCNCNCHIKYSIYNVEKCDGCYHGRAPYHISY